MAFKKYGSTPDYITFLFFSQKTKYLYTEETKVSAGVLKLGLTDGLLEIIWSYIQDFVYMCVFL